AAIRGKPGTRGRRGAAAVRSRAGNPAPPLMARACASDTMPSMPCLPGDSQRAPSPIAVDGTAGSGKSTLGAALARRYGFTLFDTGVTYRAFTLLALER